LNPQASIASLDNGISVRVAYDSSDIEEEKKSHQIFTKNLSPILPVSDRFHTQIAVRQVFFGKP